MGYFLSFTEQMQEIDVFFFKASRFLNHGVRTLLLSQKTAKLLSDFARFPSLLFDTCDATLSSHQFTDDRDYGNTNL